MLLFSTGTTDVSWFELIPLLILCAPFFLFLCDLLTGYWERGKQAPASFRDLPMRDEASGYVTASDKLDKIRRAQR